MARVVHFEISADDVGRAMRFYASVFGWRFTKWDGPMDYWLVGTGKEGELGIDGGLAKREDSSTGVTNTIDVPSVDECIEKIRENGGEVVVPRTAVPTVGWLAYFKDTEANVFGIMQMDSSAK